MKVVEDFFIYKIKLKNPETDKNHNRYFVADGIDSALSIAKEWCKDEYILSIKEVAYSTATQIDTNEKVFEL